MKVLLDECIPRKLKRRLTDHEVKTVPEAGWAGIKNGALLRLAAADFDVFITVDKHLPFQNELSTLSLAVIVLDAYDNKIATRDPLISKAAELIGEPKPGQVIRVGS